MTDVQVSTQLTEDGYMLVEIEQDGYRYSFKQHDVVSVNQQLGYVTVQLKNASKPLVISFENNNFMAHHVYQRLVSILRRSETPTTTDESEEETPVVESRLLDDPRQTVYEAINSERDYQTLTSLEWGHNGTPSFEAEILLMEQYVQSIRETWAFSPDNTEPLEEVRKLAAITVRCMENHGCQLRTKMSRKKE